MDYRRAIRVMHRFWPRMPTATLDSAAGWDLRTLLIGLMVPMGMTVLNQSIFGVALPAIRNSFMIQADTAAWLVTAYSLPFVIFMPLYGRLGDGVGKRRLFSIGILIFFIGTFFCLIADRLFLLILGRALQATGTAGVNPLCIAVISELFPQQERGSALAKWSSTGPAMGMFAPIVGGLLVDSFGWQSMYWTGIVASVVAMWAVRCYMPKLAPLVSDVEGGFLQKFDWIGMGLLSCAIMMLVAYLSSRSLTGVAPLQDWRLALATFVLGFAFWHWEIRHHHPLVPFDLFVVPNFSRASLAAGLRMILMSSQGFLIPLYLTDIYGVSGTQIGIFIMLQAGTLLMTIRYGGRLADMWSRRWPVVIGFAAQALVMAYFAILPSTVPLWVPAIGMAVHGGAAGLSLAVLHRLSMDNVPPHRSSAAAGLYSMMRFFGSIIGATVGGVILTQALDFFARPVEAYQLTFACWAAVAVMGLLTILPAREDVRDEGHGLVES
jgi:EmrB/QacA subfamily drug resistance transporter